jgi:hypothetical protein
MNHTSDESLEREFFASLSFWGDHISLDELDRLTGLTRDRTKDEQDGTSWHSLILHSDKPGGLSELLDSVCHMLLPQKEALIALMNKERLQGVIVVSLMMNFTHAFEEISARQLKVIADLNLNLRIGVL